MRFEVHVSYDNGATLSSLIFDSDVTESTLIDKIPVIVSLHLSKYPYPSPIKRVCVDIGDDK